MTTTRSELVRLEKDIDVLVKQLVRSEAPKAAAALPPCQARVRRCLESAVLWADELPRYANRQQSKADFWAMAAGIVAAVTGLAIFPVVTDSSTTRDKFVVALFAFAAAVFALVPRVRNYSEEAGEARSLATSYGPLVGRLLDAVTSMQAGRHDDEAVRAVIADFEAAKTRKDQLRYVAGGGRLDDLRDRAARRTNELLG